MSRRIDPMERLPSEIVTLIILESSLSDHRWHPCPNIQHVLALTMVSKYWQRFILSEPLLWKSIVLSNRHDMHTIISLQLKLSCDPTHRRMGVHQIHVP
ncbi:hypothetical protein CPB86DRAFT_786599 [Serendipita vermifera]|nr:hypothetical protein CPB86DRAFT_786599 [Serendipita vermifera]